MKIDKKEGKLALQELALIKAELEALSKAQAATENDASACCFGRCSQEVHHGGDQRDPQGV